MQPPAERQRGVQLPFLAWITGKDMVKGKRAIRVASWNIWAFSKRDYRGVAKLISDNKIDIIGIQEATIYYKRFVKDDVVASYRSTGPKVDMAKRIAQQLGYDYVFFPSFGRKADYAAGNAIISRFPLYGVKLYKLNKGLTGLGNESRILVASKIKVANHVINFLVTHLQASVRFKPTELRYEQVRKVIAIANKMKRNIILAGDFNSVPANRELKLLGRKLNRVGDKKSTWPTLPFAYKDWRINGPKYRVDNIYISKDLSYKRFKLLGSKLSDHFPIEADIIVG